MEAMEAIKTRRSVRGFTNENVSDEVVGQILEAGRWAPSGLNNQAWRFIVVRNEETKDVQSIGACIQNMLLAIHSTGLGGVWLGEILKNKETLAFRERFGAAW